MTTTDVSPLLVLWDVDHTLIENGGVSKEAYALAFERLTGRLAIYPARTDGRTDVEIIRDLCERHGIGETGASRDDLYETLNLALSAKFDELRERGYALPGAREALRALNSAPGLVQSVLTGNIRPNAYTKLAAFDLGDYIDFDVGGYGSDGKVRADLVSFARKRVSAKYGLDIAESATVLVGDTPRDVQAGIDGGVYVIAVASGEASEETLSAAGANAVLTNLRDTDAFVNAVLKVRVINE